MKTPILMLFSAFLTAACSNQPQPPTYLAQPANPVVTDFSKSEKDTVEIQVTDPQPAAQMELVAPDGRIFPASSIDRETVVRQRGGYSPSIGFGLGVGGWSNHAGVGTGVGFGFPFGDYSQPAAASGQVKSSARIPVADMAGYQASWQQWKVRVLFGAGASQRTLEVAAPPPPA